MGKLGGWLVFIAYCTLCYIGEQQRWNETISFGKWVALSVTFAVLFMAFSLDLDCTRGIKRFFTETYEEKMARKAAEAKKSR
ncbi:hypothetical protein [Pseudomonas aeruginosa]|uniref:hypothetical protein n=1 Tax=Pseudomonas aeruginosa TaxID=287 RepID=UPI003F859FBA|nr:hypothetical protein [Pseudomonas aeruginosa]